MISFDKFWQLELSSNSKVFSDKSWFVHFCPNKSLSDQACRLVSISASPVNRKCKEIWQSPSRSHLVTLRSPESWFLFKLADWQSSLALSPSSLTSHSMESKLLGRVTSVVETIMASWFALIEWKMSKILLSFLYPYSGCAVEYRAFCSDQHFVSCYCLNVWVRLIDIPDWWWWEYCSLVILTIGNYTI